jgi:hypothetical protein
MFCPKCGKPNIDDAKFCESCGCSFASLTPAVETALPTLPVRPAQQVPIRQPEQTRTQMNASTPIQDDIVTGENFVGNPSKNHKLDREISVVADHATSNPVGTESSVATVLTSMDNETIEAPILVIEDAKKHPHIKAKLFMLNKKKRILFIIIVAVIIALVSVFVIRAVNLSLYHNYQDAFVSWDIIHEEIDALENKGTLFDDPEIQRLVDARKAELNTLADIADEAFLSNIGGYAINDEWQNDMAKLDKLGVSESDINALIDSGVTSYAGLIFELVANHNANPNGLERALKDYFDEDVGSKIYNWFRYDNYEGKVYPEIQQVLNDSFEEDYQEACKAYIKETYASKGDNNDREVNPAESTVESNPVAAEPVENAFEPNTNCYTLDVLKVRDEAGNDTGLVLEKGSGLWVDFNYNYNLIIDGVEYTFVRFVDNYGTTGYVARNFIDVMGV